MVRNIKSFFHYQSLWGEAIKTAFYLLNKVPRKIVTKTPYELWIVKDLALDIYTYKDV